MSLPEASKRPIGRNSSKTQLHARSDVIERKLLKFVKETEDTHKLSLRLKSTTISPIDVVNTNIHSGAGDSESPQTEIEEIPSKEDSNISFKLNKKINLPTKEKHTTQSRTLSKPNIVKFHLGSTSTQSSRQSLIPNLPESIFGDDDDDEEIDKTEMEIMAKYKSKRLQVPDPDYSGYSSDPRFLDLIDALTPCFQTSKGKGTKKKLKQSANKNYRY